MDNDEKVSLCCFFGVFADELDITGIEEIGDGKWKIDYKLPLFSDEWKEIVENFGDYCVVMWENELAEKFKNKFPEDNYYLAPCIYREPNAEEIENFNKGDVRRFLFKNPDLKYQHEYRILYFDQMPEDHFLNLDKFEQAQVVDTENLAEASFSFVAE